MSDPTTTSIENMNVERDNLYREEMITDLKVASLQVLTPIKPDGTVDSSRDVLYVGQTQLISRAGPLPVSAPIEAASLAEALDKFPQAIKESIDRMVEEAREYQKQEASRIVVPSAEKPGMLPGGLGGAPPATGGITLT